MLRSEQEIMKNWKGDISKPVVSICCITYNHEKYIEDAIRGFLIQETDFPFEIIIRDDASTDSTSNIIKKYQKQYPHIIKPIFEKENTYSKGIPPFPITFKQAQGKYIALCEGDDYWIDSKKLQIQIDFLEKNNDYVYTFHNVKIYDEIHNKTIDNASLVNLYKIKKKSFDCKDIILGQFISQTLSMVFRNIFLLHNIEYPQCFDKLPFGDKSLEKFLISFGKAYYFDKEMAVYREHSGGISKDPKWKKKMKSINTDLLLYSCLSKYVNSNHSCYYILKLRKSLFELLEEKKKVELIKVLYKLSKEKNLNFLEKQIDFFKALKFYLKRIK